jgi:tetratricopeptide (TPR) repeat protein
MFDKALEIAPDHVPSIYHLGMMQHKNDNLRDALNSFTQVLNNIGKDRLVFESRGLVYMDMKNYNMAIEDFNQAIQFDETYPDNYHYRGLARIELHQLKEAIDDFNLALELDSKKPDIFSGIG